MQIKTSIFPILKKPKQLIGKISFIRKDIFIRTHLRFWFLYSLSKYLRKYVFFNSLNKKNKSRTSVIAHFIEEDLYRIAHGRYIFLIQNTFLECGYKIELFRKSISHNYYSLGDYAKPIFFTNGLGIIQRLFFKKSRGEIFLSDSENMIPDDQDINKIIIVDYDIFSNTDTRENSITMPYWFHPLIYKRRYHRNIDRMRRNKKKRTIFFSGRYKKSLYSNPIITKIFNKLTRDKVIETILTELSDNEKAYIETKKDFSCINRRYTPKIVILNPSKIKIEPKLWLKTLSESEFFLAPPGVFMPLCHNVIEAIAVGAIPITESPEYFDPPLNHMENCLFYRGKKDLVKKIKMALEMDSSHKKKMSTNAIEYYEKYLTPISFKTKLMNAQENKLKVYVNAESISVLKMAGLSDGRNYFNKIIEKINAGLPWA